ncbi:hypothetical protein GCM10017774_43370 [Lentzea cavernae]|uniref:Uncharacterized protein n=2 Tax=Lentzea cavernae TaxID=2020703 RepID=A0ABQ3MFQ0_9PSEU|nr:hypothetical protein GCM10017774_43370 [Lentzea cavernae]
MPLLSASAGCLVVITSRRELTSFVASMGASSIRIGFRLLALLPLSRTTTPAVASLTAVPVSRARAVLRELSVLCLITEDGPGQFSWHDLPDAYAAELLAENVDSEEQHAACRRMLHHYLVLTRNASLRLHFTDDVPAGEVSSPDRWRGTCATTSTRRSCGTRCRLRTRSPCTGDDVGTGYSHGSLSRAAAMLGDVKLTAEHLRRAIEARGAHQT